MSNVPQPTPQTSAAARERTERAEQLATDCLDALAAVREAVDIPYAATAGDEQVRTPILLHRVMALCVFLSRALSEDDVSGLLWSVAYLRERLTRSAKAPRLRSASAIRYLYDSASSRACFSPARQAARLSRSMASWDSARSALISSRSPRWCG
jgi:hypothetical protein